MTMTTTTTRCKYCSRESRYTATGATMGVYPQPRALCRTHWALLMGECEGDLDPRPLPILRHELRPLPLPRAGDPTDDDLVITAIQLLGDACGVVMPFWSPVITATVGVLRGAVERGHALGYLLISRTQRGELYLEAGDETRYAIQYGEMLPTANRTRDAR